MKYRNQSPWKRIISSPVSSIVLLIVIIFLIKGTINIIKKYETSLDRLVQAQATLDNLESRKNDLEEKVAYLSTDRGIESEIRSKFRVALEGESVAVIVDESSAPTTSPIKATKQISWWRKWLKVFGI